MKNRFHLLLTYSLLFLILSSVSSHAQVAINHTGDTPDNSAMLDIESSTRGILIPRMSSTQRLAINNPAEGLMVYDTISNSFWYYSDAWLEISDDQQISRDGLTVTLENGGSFQDSVLSDDDLTTYLGNNGYLTRDEVQLSISGTALYIEGTQGTVNLSSFLDNTDNQQISRNEDTIFLEDGGYVLDSVLTETDVDAMVANNGYLTSDSLLLIIDDSDANVYHENSIGDPDNLLATATTIYGAFAAENMVDGSSSTAVGVQAMQSTINTSNNTAIGANALGGSQYGNDNTAIGAFSLLNVTHNTESGAEVGNVALGKNSGISLDSGSYNLYLGTNSGSEDTDANENHKLYINNADSYSSTPLIGGDFEQNRVGVNIHIDSMLTGATLQVGGDLSLENGEDVNEFSSDETLSDSSNTAVPTEAAVKYYVDSSSEAIGVRYDEQRNLVLESTDFPSITSATDNVLLGQYTGTYITTGTNNVFMGRGAGSAVRSAVFCIAIGNGALASDTSGQSNIAIGLSSLLQLQGPSLSTIPKNNIGIGQNTGVGVAYGDNNLYLGASAGPELQIGGGIEQHDKLYINSAGAPTDTPLVGGDFEQDRVGINIDMDSMATGATLQVGGDLSLENGEDVNEFSSDNTLADSSNTAIPTEAAVKSYVDNQGFLTSEVDGSTNNEIQDLDLTNNTLSIENGNSVDLSSYLDNTDDQQISREGLTVTLENGGSFQDSVLTESDVDAMIADNGYLTAETQQISRSGLTVTLENGGSFQDSVLAESDVDAMIADNGYLTTETQQISRSGLTVTLENGGSFQDSVLTESDVDAMIADNGYLTTETQQISRSGLTVTLENGGSFQDSVLTESDVDAMIADNGYLTAETQQISRSGLTVTLENGGSFQDSVLAESKVVEIIETNMLSVDPSLSDSSNTAIPTEAAVKYYVDSSVAQTGIILDEDNNLYSLDGPQGPILGLSNVVFGNFAAYGGLPSSVSNNIIIGDNNMVGAQEARQNIAIGSSALVGLQKGYRNSVYGSGSLNVLASQDFESSYNSSFGVNSGNQLDSGSYNLFIGSYAGPENQTDADGVYESYKLYINSSSASSNTPLIGGDFDHDRLGINMHIDSMLTGATLQVGGDLSLQNGEDVDEFSSDETFADSSNTAIPTEAAVKYYVDSTVANSGYLTAETQQISRNGLTVSLQNGGSFEDSVLTESKVVEIVETNLLSTDETLGDSSNSAIPTEAAVKYYVDNSITNAYQTLSLIEDTLFISGGDHTDFQADLSSLKIMATAGNTNVYSGTGNFASLDENTSTSNTAIGRSAMNAFQSGNHNTAMGRYSLLELENANYNTSMGSSALREATDTDNQTAMGYSALREHKYGSDNLALGNEALRRANGGSYNVALGSEAMAFADSGSYNIALGYESLNSINGADSNIAIGSQALHDLVSGNANVAIGAQAAQNYTGKASVFLGHYAGQSETSTDSVLYIANSNTSTPLIGGDFANGKVGIGRSITEIKNASYALQVNGDASKSVTGAWSANSDKRLKTNIIYMDADQILQQVLNMKGVTYQWNDTVTGYSRPEGIQYGFIAQDLQKVWPSKISEDGLGYLKTAYGDYDPMFVEAIKALYSELQQTKQTNKNLIQKLTELEASHSSQLKAQQEQLNENKALIEQMSQLLKKLDQSSTYSAQTQ